MFLVLLGRKSCTQCINCYGCCTYLGLSVCLSVYVLVTQICPAKMAEPMVMTFGGWLAWVQRTMY